jgi:hypothetical protein
MSAPAMRQSPCFIQTQTLRLTRCSPFPRCALLGSRTSGKHAMVEPCPSNITPQIISRFRASCMIPCDAAQLCVRLFDQACKLLDLCCFCMSTSWERDVRPQRSMSLARHIRRVDRDRLGGLFAGVERSIAGHVAVV